MDALPPSPSLSILLAIRAEVVRRETMEERVRIMSWMIEVGSHLRRLNNFNSLMYFLAGLSAPGVYRLKQVWRRRVTCGVGKDRVAGWGDVAALSFPAGIGGAERAWWSARIFGDMDVNLDVNLQRGGVPWVRRRSRSTDPFGFRYARPMCGADTVCF